MDPREEMEALRQASGKKLKWELLISLAISVTLALLLRQYALILLGPILCMIVFAILGKGKDTARYRELYKQAYVRKILEEQFPGVVYLPESGIPQWTVAETGMMDTGDRFHSEDYVSGYYKDVHFEQSDVRIEVEEKEIDDKGNTSTKYVCVFGGRWLIFAFNKSFRAELIVVSKDFPNLKKMERLRRKSNRLHEIRTESEAFHERFLVYAEDDHTAFYLLTPSMMERILRLDATGLGTLLFSFRDNRLHVAVHGVKNAFEPPAGMGRIDEAAVRSQILAEIDPITQLVEDLRLDNDLFKQDQFQ